MNCRLERLAGPAKPILRDYPFSVSTEELWRVGDTTVKVQSLWAETTSNAHPPWPNHKFTSEAWGESGWRPLIELDVLDPRLGFAALISKWDEDPRVKTSHAPYLVLASIRKQARAELTAEVMHAVKVLVAISARALGARPLRAA